MKLLANLKIIGNSILMQTKYPTNLKDGDYEIDIKPFSKHRSNNQNRYMWELLNEISKKQYGNISEAENIYVQCLEMAGAKYDTIYIKNEALERLKSLVRSIKVIGTKDDYSMVQIFYGSSTMNTKEMSVLIDTIIYYASEIGIDTDYWRELLCTSN